MSKITFQCYSCSQTLRVDAEKAGRKAKCPGCGTLLTIPVASTESEAAAPPVPVGIQSVAANGSAQVVAPVSELPLVTAAIDEPVASVADKANPPVVTAAADDDAYFEEDNRAGGFKKKKKKSAKNWMMTRIGLLVIFISLCLLVFNLFLFHIAALIEMIDDIQGKSVFVLYVVGGGLDMLGASSAKNTILKISGILFLLAIIPWFVGQVLTLFGPRNTTSISTTAAALVLGGLGWLVFLLLRVLVFFHNHIFTVHNQFPMFLWYAILPALFWGLIFVGGAFQLYGVANLTQSRWMKMCMGCAATLGICMIVQVLWYLLLSIIKVEPSGGKALQWGHWILYWLCAVAELASLAGLAFSAFMVRRSART
jgi:hypothetical protein